MTSKLKASISANFPWLVDFWHRLQGMWAIWRAGNPGKELKVIGVTGTNGKTTTATMIARILEEAGHKVGALTSFEHQIGQHRELNDTLMTTLPPGFLQRKLREMVKARCEYAVLEISSHALQQHRSMGIPFRTAVFTNLTHEHLDYHKTMSAYRAAKLRLFEGNPRTAVINLDDKAAESFMREPAFQRFTYGVESRADIVARKVLPEAKGTLFTVVTPVGQVVVNLAVPGLFNVSNALAAIAVGIAEGVPLSTIKKALEHFQSVPGRMERVQAGQPFEVIVDFALTPDALQKLYETLRPTVKGRLISVLGATGRRDVSKRPLLGAIAGRWADLVVVTNEDPYDEDPDLIMRQVAAGIPRGNRRHKKVEGKDFVVIADRGDAIRFALNQAKPGDLVLVTGKGGERWMVTKEGKVPWDDVEVIKKALAK